MQIGISFVDIFIFPSPIKQSLNTLAQIKKNKVNKCVCDCKNDVQTLNMHTHRDILARALSFKHSHTPLSCRCIFLLPFEYFCCCTRETRKEIERRSADRRPKETDVAHTFLPFSLCCCSFACCVSVCVEKSQISRPLWQNYYSRTR